MYLYTCISVVIFLFGTVVVTNPTLGHYPFQINDVCAEMLFPDSCLLPKAKATLVGIDKIYIIHWGGNPDRERVMNQRLSKILPVGWQEKEIVSFVKSLDPVSLNVSMISCLGQFVSQADVKIGTVSLTAKHHLAYYDMLHHHYEIALVLEDDVDFDSSFLEKLYTVSSELKKIGGVSWSNCFISGCIPSYGCGTHQSDTICKNTLGYSNCAYGYLISKLGARQHMTYLPLLKEKGGIQNPDWVMNNIGKNNPLTYRSLMSGDANIVFAKPIGSVGTWNQ